MPTTKPETDAAIDPKALAKQYEKEVQDAVKFKVTNLQQHADAVELDRILAGKVKLVNDKLDPVIKKAHETHKALTTLKAEALAPIKEAREHLQAACYGYKRQEEQRAQEEQRRREEEARKKAEEERRLEAERAKKEGATKKEVKEILSAPVVVAPPPVVVPRVAHVEGSSTREVWDAEVTDKKALFEFVHKNYETTHQIFDPSMPVLNEIARRQKGNMAVPGVKANVRGVMQHR